MELLRGNFRPEFINRIDEIIVFRALSEAQLLDITRLLLDRLNRRLRAQRIEVEFSEGAVQLLAREGTTPSSGHDLYGARSSGSSRTSSPGWCSMDVEPGDKAAVDVDDDQLRFEVEKGAAPELLREAEEKTPEPAGSPV